MVEDRRFGLARSRLTVIPCFASWTLSNCKSTPALAHSRNSFKMYFVHWELLIKPYPHKIKNRITDVIRFFMVECYVRISTRDSQNSYLVLLFALSVDRNFLSQYLKQKISEKNVVSAKNKIYVRAGPPYFL